MDQRGQNEGGKMMKNFRLLLAQVSVSGHMEFVKVSRPDVFECLCDSVSSETNKLKRVQKSVNRTLRFLDDTLVLKQDCQVGSLRHLDKHLSSTPHIITLCYLSSEQALEQCGVLGAVVGGDIVAERVRSSTETAKRPVDGMHNSTHCITFSADTVCLCRVCNRRF